MCQLGFAVMMFKSELSFVDFKFWKGYTVIIKRVLLFLLL